MKGADLSFRVLSIAKGFFQSNLKVMKAKAKEVREHGGSGVVKPDELDKVSMIRRVLLKARQDHAEDLGGIQFKES